MNPRTCRPRSAIIPVLLTFLLALAGVLLSSSASTAATNLVTNGTFETGSLAGWVKGPNVYLGADGGSSTWSTNTAWNQLTTTFATSASATTVTVYWSAATDANGIDHYDMVRGTNAAQNVGNVTSWTDTTWPTLRGAMTWSTNWDALNGNAFSSQVGAHVHALP
jgi:hypothetical protein